MKTRTSFHRFVSLALLGLSPLVLAAAGGPPAGAPRHGQGGNGNGGPNHARAAANDDLTALERFLDMDDAQLDRIQRAIAKVRAMSPEERAALHARLNAFRQLPEAQRERVRAGWRDDRDQADWPVMMRSLPEAERSAIQTEIQALSPTQRATRKHELLEVWRAQFANQPDRD